VTTVPVSILSIQHASDNGAVDVEEAVDIEENINVEDVNVGQLEGDSPEGVEEFQVADHSVNSRESFRGAYSTISDSQDTTGESELTSLSDDESEDESIIDTNMIGSVQRSQKRAWGRSPPVTGKKQRRSGRDRQGNAVIDASRNTSRLTQGRVSSTLLSLCSDTVMTSECSQTVVPINIFNASEKRKKRKTRRSHNIRKRQRKETKSQETSGPPACGRAKKKFIAEAEATVINAHLIAKAAGIANKSQVDNRTTDSPNKLDETRVYTLEELLDLQFTIFEWNGR
jgi:hypothetical protein